jgi:hypothetical protein
MSATACAVAAGLRTDGGRRIGWLCMAVGFSGWVIGDVSWAYYALTGQQPPFPSIADYTYLLLPLSVCAAAVLAPGRARSGIGLVLEGVIVSASLFLVAWSIGLHGIYAASGLSGLPFAMSVAAQGPTAIAWSADGGDGHGWVDQPEAVVVVRPPRHPSRVALWQPYLPVPFAAPSSGPSTRGRPPGLAPI